MRAAFAASRKRGGLGDIPPREIHSLEFDKQSPQDMSSFLKSCEVYTKSLRALFPGLSNKPGPRLT